MSSGRGRTTFVGIDGAWTNQSEPPPQDGTWRLVERAVAYTVFWGLLGAMVPLGVYVSEVVAILRGAASVRWLVQVITFLVVTTAACSGTIAAAVCLARALRLGPASEVAFATLGGAVSAPMFGALGVSHFGALPLPYVGGVVLATTSACTLLLVAAAYARSERPQPSLLRVFLAALAPTIPLGLISVLGLLVFPEFSLDLDVMRVFAEKLGMSGLGAVIGLVVGATGGFWFGSTSWLARVMSDSSS